MAAFGRFSGSQGCARSHVPPAPPTTHSLVCHSISSVKPRKLLIYQQHHASIQTLQNASGPCYQQKPTSKSNPPWTPPYATTHFANSPVPVVCIISPQTSCRLRPPHTPALPDPDTAAAPCPSLQPAVYKHGHLEQDRCRVARRLVEVPEEVLKVGEAVREPAGASRVREGGEVSMIIAMSVAFLPCANANC
jgi:hypothetical protein